MRGCQRQPLHSDFNVNDFIGDAIKPCSVLLALQDGTTLHFAEHKGCPVTLSRGDLLVWDGDVAHAGSEYASENTRFFMYIATPSAPAPVNATYPYRGPPSS